MTRARLWLRSVLLGRRLEREMQAEMAGHIERSTDRLMARGLSPEAARREALLEFGNVGYLQEEGRIARGVVWLDRLQADLRFALRHFIRNPLSTLTIVAVLAIGIAINVVLFTIVYSFTDRPPSGVEASDDLVRIRGSQLGLGGRAERAFTMEEVEAYAGLEDHFSAVAAWTSQPVTAEGPDAEEITVTATFVTGDYFEVLGAQPVLGSGLQRDADQVAVLSHATWSRSFAEDPGVLGRTIVVNDVPITIVGVAPPLFRGAYWEARDDMQLWVPMADRSGVLAPFDEEAEIYRVVARLRPGITREAAGAAVNVVADRILTELDRARAQDGSQLGRDPSAEVVPLLADNLQPDFETNARLVKLVFGVLGLLTLLVTCANVSALQTGLALARRREIVIRMSLGAQRARIIRQLVTENLLLATLAGGAAVGVTLAIIRVLLAIVGSLSFELVFDGTSLFFTFGVALTAGLLFGLSPALHATRVAIAGALKDSASSVAGGRAGLQRGLVVAQIALTQPLAVCVAALVLFGVFEYRENRPTPNAEQIVRLRLASPGARDISITGGAAAAAEREGLELERLATAIREIPGIAGAVYQPNRASVSRTAFRVAGAAGPEREAEPFYVTGQAVMPGYLEIVDRPILLGRDLERADTAAYRAGAIPAIVGDDMARSLWGDGNPIGRRIESAADGEAAMMLEVVGVHEEAIDASGDSRDNFSVFLPADPRPTGRSPNGYLLIRTSTSAEAAMPAIRTVVHDEVPRAAITELLTLAALEDEQRFVLRGGIGLILAGGLVVLLLSALGLYAVVAFAVGQRTGEIAVRMAIGARARQIVRHFASDGFRLGIVGILIGLPLSVVGLRALLPLQPTAPPLVLPAVTSIVAIGVLMVAGLATWIPARRAARVDPAVTLRRD
ncbi:MAG: ABC transporter permease [Gemmatimonadota bacterium]